MFCCQVAGAIPLYDDENGEEKDQKGEYPG
jgi:hypothetical protein